MHLDDDHGRSLGGLHSLTVTLPILNKSWISHQASATLILSFLTHIIHLEL